MSVATGLSREAGSRWWSASHGWGARRLRALARPEFGQVTDQLPFRARCLTRLRTAILEAVIASGCAVEKVATAFGVGWHTVQALVTAAVMALPEVDHRGAAAGDEHRFRTVRFFRDEASGWRIGVVDGRHPRVVLPPRHLSN